MDDVDALDFRKLEFRSPEHPDKHWIEWYVEEVARWWTKIEMQVPPTGAHRFNSTMRVMPGIMAWFAESTPVRCRNLPHLVDDDDLTLTVLLGGNFSARAGTEFDLSPGAAVVLRNQASNGVSMHSPTRYFAMKISRRLVAPLLERPEDLNGLHLTAGNQALRLLLAYVRSLDDEVAIEAPEARQMMSLHLRDLFALAVGATRDGVAEAKEGGVRAARFAAIKADVLANLTHRELTVDWLAGRHGISPRYIRSLFAGIGTSFTDFVLQQRLAHAYRLLTDPRFSSWTVSSIAFESGFGDLSYFNHAFRRRFAGTPSDIRAAARQG